MVPSTLGSIQCYSAAQSIHSVSVFVAADNHYCQAFWDRDSMEWNSLSSISASENQIHTFALYIIRATFNLALDDKAFESLIIY